MKEGLEPRGSGDFLDVAAGGDGIRSRSVSSTDPAEWSDLEGLLSSRGLQPDEWHVVRVRVNEWGGAGEASTQLRVDCEPVERLLLPARAKGWVRPEGGGVPVRDGELVVFFGDQHVPHHDEALHVAACEWLREHKPDRVYLLGDLLDFDQVSRHRHDPARSATIQDTIDGAYRVVRGLVDACPPGTRFLALDGNHEDRLRNAVLDGLRPVHGVRRAGDGGERPVLSTPFLLRFDELGVEWKQSPGGYELAQVQVTPHLAARHGWIARKGSGASALSTLSALSFNYSVVIGHCHRQAIVHHTAHTIDGDPRVVCAVEAGTMAQVAGGLGYASAGNPDWQAGFATAHVFPDGSFTFDLASWVGGRLMWRDWSYAP